MTLVQKSCFNYSFVGLTSKMLYWQTRQFESDQKSTLNKHDFAHEHFYKTKLKSFQSKHRTPNLKSDV